MKTIKILLRVSVLMAILPLFSLSCLFSQLPQKMSYQAVIRNNADILVTNTQVGMRVSILQSSADGTVVYSEIQSPVTNMNGMVSIEIGGEAGFSAIDWLAGPYFIKTEIAIKAPLTNYTINGTSEILSVPYAKVAHTAFTFDKLISRETTVCNESSEGSMRYNPATRLVEYCNGSNWAALKLGLTISLATVNTTPVSSITTSTAQSGGSISNNGGAEILQKGLCWGLEALPTISGSKTIHGAGSASFGGTLTGLFHNTMYFTRAYTTNNLGTGYGEERAFTTLPSLTTMQASENTAASFLAGGVIQAGGGQPIQARGVAYGTGTNPNISGSITEAGTGTGVFSSLISGLPSNTLYFLRAYATNGGGTNYGNQQSTVTLAEVISADHTDVTNNSLTAGGEVLPGGGANISARGIVYGTIENPDISGPKTNNGSGMGVFSSTASTLASNSLYHYRAYATNMGGTSYGQNKTAATLALLTTREAVERTLTSFVTGGDIETGGGQSISERGVVYDTTTNPTIMNNKVIASEPGTGGFSVTLENLSNKTNNYYYKSYALNSGGVSYGSENSSGYFDTPGEGFTDSRDGTSYATVWIGGKEWMAENLKYLPSVVGYATGSSSIPYYYVYDYNGYSVSDAKTKNNYEFYGVLYNWTAAMEACPAGWHLPTDAEWSALESYLTTYKYSYDGIVSNKIAKSLATTDYWSIHTGTGTVGNSDYPAKRNVTGFSALPGGYRYNYGTFYDISKHGRWWSATDYANEAYCRGMSYDLAHIGRYMYYKELGFSVRCIKD
jgi:uncharacterized protein (TIGR02145 family)